MTTQRAASILAPFMHSLVLVAALVLTQARSDPSTVTLYEYDDGSGPQQVERLRGVPKKYRARARLVTATTVDAPLVAPERSSARRNALGQPGQPSVEPHPEPGAPRVTCSWSASVRANVTSRRNDSDCGGGTCINGGCVKGGTRQGYSVREVGGKQWTGTYSNNGQLAAVRNECENHARSKAGEADVTCSSSFDRAP